MKSRSILPSWPAWSAYCGLANQASRLMIDAQHVIVLRLVKIAQGGAAADAEALLMIHEKVAALMQSQAIIGKAALSAMQAGKSSNGSHEVFHLYQRRVAANRRRLGRF